MIPAIHITELFDERLQDARAFLRRQGRLPADFAQPPCRYWAACDSDQIVGTIGLEWQGAAGLVRLAFVRPSHRSRRLGLALYHRLASDALCMGLTELYLFSTGAGGYWRRLGFASCPVAEAAGKLANTPQVRDHTARNTLHHEQAFHRSLLTRRMEAAPA
ncbi:MAG TPA: GNAT family N-acetyltransferase [Ideonella sp.]|uniref:GNAT family N-acetyltransferase n=1 Tax=Ideonella sp. TaxID=1929293 RepID=UPI002E35800E|nr:GNAT family N-acetyltransferase [Ideonella sp.]HEX5686862.1 GNAT family N-acetyltransferase [Ideonella sp.]